MKSWLKKNDIETYSTHNEGKSVVAERFIETERIKFINTWLQFQKISILKHIVTFTRLNVKNLQSPGNRN